VANYQKNAIKNVRAARNPTAHRLEIDRYDLAIFDEQTELIRDGYRAILTLRQLLQSHPAAAGYEPPRLLRHGKVWWS
jgi:hypothetical protein